MYFECKAITIKMHHNSGGKEKNPQIVLGMNRECNVKDEKWKKKRINIGKRKPYT